MASQKQCLEAIFLDLGDVIMKESTEVKDENGVTKSAELLPGAKETLHELKKKGYSLGLVSDTKIGTYKNVLTQHDLYGLFEAFAISEEVGVSKPDGKMFDKALEELEVAEENRSRVLMVGNNLEVDIVGARRAGIISTWLHWNDRYKTEPESGSEVPDFTIESLPELLNLVDRVEKVFKFEDRYFDAEVVKKFAPTIYLDEKEPFRPVVTGCTVADITVPSPSFPRILRPNKEGQIIEYAIYWDWDIEHHYELEHVWVHTQNEEINKVEGSFHGQYFELWPNPPDPKEMRAAFQKEDQNRCSLKIKGDPIGVGEKPPKVSPKEIPIYSQPGKHAFTYNPELFRPRSHYIKVCQEQAGSGGLIDGVYEDLHHSQDSDVIMTNFLKKKSFEPTFRFSNLVELSKETPFVSWPKLYQIIPKRVEAWLEALSNGKNKPEELPPKIDNRP